VRKKVMPAALEAIPALIERGMSAAEIAGTLGCTVGTLRVKCSQMGISLRRRTTRPFRDVQTLTLALPRRVMERLQDQAAAKGISNSKLISLLLEVIARDDLYAAVLDGNEDAGTLTQPEKGF